MTTTMAVVAVNDGRRMTTETTMNDDRRQIMTTTMDDNDNEGKSDDGVINVSSGVDGGIAAATTR